MPFNRLTDIVYQHYTPQKQAQKYKLDKCQNSLVTAPITKQICIL